LSKVNDKLGKQESILGVTTLAIERVMDEDYGARIIDALQGSIYVKETPLELIKHLCQTYLCTYEGRRQATAKVFGYEKKSPILIHQEENIYTFPTSSPYADECVWLFPYHIKHTARKTPSETEVIFKNGESIIVEASYRTV